MGKPLVGGATLRHQHTYLSVDEGLRQADACDLIFLATPAETSLKMVPHFRQQGIKVIDLSGAFRLGSLADYRRFYGFDHTSPELLKEAVYGLPELSRASIQGQNFVANPGCYPTAAALAVAPLLLARLVDEESIVVTAASGVSGAGRKATEELTFMEVDSDFKAYKVLRHQHQPEIAQTMTLLASNPVGVTFTAHLLPIKRGILSTAVMKVKENVTQAAIDEAFLKMYNREPLVQYVKTPDDVRITDVVHTPRAIVGAATDGRVVVAISAIDNLLKGAASQAIQNMNLMYGFTETLGLHACQ